MKCIICKLNCDLTPEGRFPIHRVPGADRYTFCDMSGESAELAVRAEAS